MLASHKSIDFPFVSKSSLITYRDCKYKFKLRYIDGIEAPTRRSADRGTFMHSVYDRFFDVIDPYKVYTLVDLGINYKNPKVSPLYDYLLSKVNEILGPQLSHMSWPRGPVHGFITFECHHAANVYNNTDGYEQFKKYFMPLAREIFLVDENLQIYGTIDRVNLDFDPERIVIIDYKNKEYFSKRMKSDFIKDGYSTKLEKRHVWEGNFYTMLYAVTKEGYSIGGNIPNGADFYVGAEKMTISHRFEYAFLSFSFSKFEDRPYILQRKKPSIRTIRSILKTIGEMRSEILFPRRDDIYICKWCDYYETECKGLLERVDKYLA